MMDAVIGVIVAMILIASSCATGLKIEQSKWTCTKSEIINGSAVCVAQERERAK